MDGSTKGKAQDLEEDRSEFRAYLQRGETRLSTLHRVAGAFISGAGLLTLLPILVSGTFSGLLALVLFYPANGIPLPASPERWLLLVPVVASLLLPLVALYFLIRDLTLFYFTARTFHTDRRGNRYPRFVLSGIMVSESVLNGSLAELKSARDEEYVRQLLVPSPAAYRRRLLKEAQSIGDLTNSSMNDNQDLLEEELREYVLNQTASHVRTLPQEAAKMEASIARHNRFLRSLVLRYSKAFLLTIVTTVATLAASGVLNLLRPIDGEALPSVDPIIVWLASLCIYSAWGLAAAIVVRKPVEWLYADTSDDKAKKTPQSLLNFERATLAVVLVASAFTALAATTFAVGADLRAGAVAWLLVIAILISTALTLVAIVRVIWVETFGK